MKKIILCLLILSFSSKIQARHDHSQKEGEAVINHVLSCRSGVNYVENLPVPALISLASAYLKTGDYEKAASSYHKILEKHPNSSMAYWGLMKVYKASKQQDQYKNAKLQFEEVTRYGDRVVFN